MIRGIPASDYPAVEAKVWPFLARIQRHDKDGITAQDYHQMIVNRERQLWVLGDWEAIALTLITPEAVRLEWVVGKNRHKWQDVLDDELRKWGKALGKKRLLVMARPGWAKLAKERGYREMQRAFEVKL